MWNEVVSKPYGWIFHYQSTVYVLDRANIGAALAGNAPFIVSRIDCGLHVLTTGVRLQELISKYESVLPEAVLQLEPEVAGKP